jgi:AcrR family transcriptional regulator
MIAQHERRAATIAAILDAARKLFAARGFADTSVDAIAAEAGLAKGAVYHHFRSKEDILDHLVDAIQAEVAAAIPDSVRQYKTVRDRLYRGTLEYLTAITAPAIRRIVLIDGPAILGWERWREIDQKYFAPLMRGPLGAGLRGRMNECEIQAMEHLIAGAMMEAALVCASSETPEQTARDMAKAFRTLVGPLLNPQ